MVGKNGGEGIPSVKKRSSRTGFRTTVHSVADDSGELLGLLNPTLDLVK